MIGVVTRRDRLLATLLQTAPVWGLPVLMVTGTLSGDTWNFALILGLGFCMFAAGLLIPLPVLGTRGFALPLIELGRAIVCGRRAWRGLL